MSDKNRHFFVNGNTAQGFVNKLNSNLQGLEKLIILRGAFGTGKACCMHALASACEATGFPLEYLHCPSAPDTYDGLIIPALRLAVIDGTDLHYTDEKWPVPEVSFIDTDTIFDRALLDTLKELAASAASEIENLHDSAFSCFGEALHIHDEWEKIYIGNMDFSKADLLTVYVEELLLDGRRLQKHPVAKVRYFGASTPGGAMDYISSLTAGISKRYLLKGRPGTGKSTLLKKLAAASAKRGLNTEVYHCAFDSNSLDMIIWPELDKCLFDSTSPHLYEPAQSGDELIDMYAGCVKTGTDEKYAPELSEITARYQLSVQAGTNHLAKAKSVLDTLMNQYTALADTDRLSRLISDFSGQLRPRF